MLQLQLRTPLVRLVTMNTLQSYTPGKRIEQLREKAGYSQGQLARLIGISRTAVSNWESNKAQPAGANLLKCAAILRTSPDFILSGKETTNANANSLQNDGLAKTSSVRYILLPLITDFMIEHYLDNNLPLPSECEKVPVVVDDLKIKKDATVVYTITGDAMLSYDDPQKSLIHGELAIIDRARKAETGNIVLAKVSDKNYKIRELTQDGAEYYLKAYNKNYASIKIHRDQILGVIISTIRNKIY
jgi:transcriptional regulator with XRE-family HTH domain